MHLVDPTFHWEKSVNSRTRCGAFAKRPHAGSWERDHGNYFQKRKHYLLDFYITRSRKPSIDSDTNTDILWCCGRKNMAAKWWARFPVAEGEHLIGDQTWDRHTQICWLQYLNRLHQKSKMLSYRTFQEKFYHCIIIDCRKSKGKQVNYRVIIGFKISYIFY